MARPPQGRSLIPGPARLGMVDPQAADRLASLGWDRDEDIDLLWALSRAPDPDRALLAIDRLRDALASEWEELDAALREDTGLRGRLLSVVGSSTALADHLIARPHLWHKLRGQDLDLPDAEGLRANMLAAVEAGAEPEQIDGIDLARSLIYRAATTGHAAIPALRNAYRDELLLLAAADLAATVQNEPVLPYPSVVRHLSDLAAAALTAALAVAVATVCPDKPCPSRLSVIAMGKCGARELNYVSDVDVIFIAEPADSTATRLASEMMRIGSAAFFEVDAALRPEGKSGALVRTLDAHIAYYKRWAHTWEFQALLKARPMTGDMTLGEQYVTALNPMVWVVSERDDFVDNVRKMRRRVESLIPDDIRDREIKLGAGGLRDVEFAVQLLQLVHGRVDDTLHVTATTEALTALASGGYIGREDAANLTASYEFLRLLEHRLQMQRLSRTHTLPALDDGEALRWLARAAHIRPDGKTDAAGMLIQDIKRNISRVRRIHTKLFYRPLLESVSKLDTDALRLPEEAATRQLAALGYSAPRNALGHLQALSGGVTRSNRIQALLLPTLLDWLSDTPNQDAGLLAYRRMSEELRDKQWFLRTLRDEGAAARRLMHILGCSAYVPELLLRAPDVLRLYADGAHGPKLIGTDPDDVSKGLLASATRHGSAQRAISAARSLRRAELARVASADILGMLSVPAVCHALSSVWVAVLEAALGATIASSVEERGEPAPARIAVIGMGRLGGAEISYGSDADVLFVCEPQPGIDETVAVKWATGIAEALRKHLGAPSTDPPLEVDTNLRPEGRSGPMVRTLAAYDAYYSQWAQIWEVQALLRAHQVAGDHDLGIEFLHIADKARYPQGGVSSNAVREIRRIKARIDSERLPRGADPKTHTKLGRGGRADVEWTVQLLQLQHAHELTSLRNTSTLETLDAIAAEGLLSEEDTDLLREAWVTATKVRNALVLSRGKPSDQIPAGGPDLRAVAYVAGWRGDPGEFVENYRRITRRARTVVERVFGG
ncbi:bifunctional [glutamine synthetase] adenylyltransferase/[glutamine synthetase]-adenylyl-L-tyrosine phosphorylase [Hoyosella sp. G463]|uniref:Bifunctional glutamine synthetase adenylyltransferase/adenylyl-removing enzyme n=1 Tax=Lolliginicoccus lacisalsi TaxID=2742202 RepID=A0A927PLN1_9ACTN|nr:bifunctional [glutamine synthetase] adenylyltransferase/[glutamine synthetase]-adenylyl-L-tyrosine phosphorylase [Lolliginicoccus lacisalsi]MBD8505552.1 bifunctional [glutamine synthetase] adenylyltransferase/[glutamine synthetase]-adenylyl-L-tyrosine phosphorylase [Lolliginicoccus lacisalsi]